MYRNVCELCVCIEMCVCFKCICICVCYVSTEMCV